MFQTKFDIQTESWEKVSKYIYEIYKSEETPYLDRQKAF